MHHFSGNLGQWPQHKGILTDLITWNIQAIVVNDDIVIQQQIKVYGSRTEFGTLAITSVTIFDIAQLDRKSGG